MNILSPIGMCTTCKYVKVIKSARGSMFVMCNRAKVDSRLAKYPVLPVIHCPGYDHVLQNEVPASPNLSHDG